MNEHISQFPITLLDDGGDAVGVVASVNAGEVLSANIPSCSCDRKRRIYANFA